MSSLLDEGAGDLDSKAFQEQMDLKGLEMSYASTFDRFSGTMRVLERDLKDAIDLVALSVNAPRFEQNHSTVFAVKLLQAFVAKRVTPIILLAANGLNAFGAITLMARIIWHRRKS